MIIFLTISKIFAFVMVAQENYLIETVLLSTHKIMFC